jgi:hypothetical protein
MAPRHCPIRTQPHGFYAIYLQNSHINKKENLFYLGKSRHYFEKVPGNLVKSPANLEKTLRNHVKTLRNFEMNPGKEAVARSVQELNKDVVREEKPRFRQTERIPFLFQ